VEGLPFVHASARIHFPPHLSLGDRSCLGERSVVYSLAPIEVRAHATVSTEAFLCTGTHDFSDANIPVQTAPIIVGAHAFVCARAFILPGMEIGEYAVVGACAVVTQDVPPSTIVAGNPARPIGLRPVGGSSHANEVCG